MKYKFYTADVFTDRIFGGNQLAVFPDARGLSDKQMLNIAREFNLSETTFILPAEPGKGRRLRIFTPGRELDFAGHPTVGSAYVLASTGALSTLDDRTEIVFEEGVGPVPVQIRSENGKPYFTQLTAAQLPQLGPPPPPTEHIAAALSLSVEDVLDNEDDSPTAMSCGLPFLYVPLASIDAVRRARLNWEWWEQWLASYWAPHIYLFSYETEREESSVHARMFGASLGIDEDPATGAAATALAGYLTRRPGASSAPGTDGTLRWTVEQGFEMGRPSIIHVEADVSEGSVTEIRVGGTSVMVSEGEMYL